MDTGKVFHSNVNIANAYARSSLLMTLIPLGIPRGLDKGI
ncbi:hypothetical protein bcere0005_51610 [Bacillus cereus 172560W]|nr:hypothetical protein bcere0005_51610 [Bacillus cereus 172560W]